MHQNHIITSNRTHHKFILLQFNCFSLITYHKILLFSIQSRQPSTRPIPHKQSSQKFNQLCFTFTIFFINYRTTQIIIDIAISQTDNFNMTKLTYVHSCTLSQSQQYHETNTNLLLKECLIYTSFLKHYLSYFLPIFSKNSLKHYDKQIIFSIPYQLISKIIYIFQNTYSYINQQLQTLMNLFNLNLFKILITTISKLPQYYVNIVYINNSHNIFTNKLYQISVIYFRPILIQLFYVSTQYFIINKLHANFKLRLFSNPSKLKITVFFSTQNHNHYENISNYSVLLSTYNRQPIVFHSFVTQYNQSQFSRRNYACNLMIKIYQLINLDPYKILNQYSHTMNNVHVLLLSEIAINVIKQLIFTSPNIHFQPTLRYLSANVKSEKML
eukprot:TRINITY_DN4525_c3_g1_i3.p1 TRINITY_DN4525_c3_g1~~TRINITY_DN4525_c3_g1_i3.p1  ORF type:complete len:401 (-),score=-57.91 TRINITY_DN4525_c3_g1_i3:1084-2238(-)